VPGPSNSLKALEIRRKLLTSEAEIHREGIRHNWGEFKASFQAIEGAIRPVRSVFSIASTVIAGISSFKRLRGAKGGTLSKILAGAGLVSTLWMAVRNRSRDSGLS
jgi:hypothetical protein